MKTKTKRLLVNIAAVLVMINAVSVFAVTAFIFNFNILKVYCIGSMGLALVLLLVVSSIGKQSKKEYDEASSKNNYTPKYNFPQNILSNIWNRVLSSTSKIQKIFNNSKIKQQVPKHYKATNNHSFHTKKLTREAKSVNQKYAGK